MVMNISLITFALGLRTQESERNGEMVKDLKSVLSDHSSLFLWLSQVYPSVKEEREYGGAAVPVEWWVRSVFSLILHKNCNNF